MSLKRRSVGEKPERHSDSRTNTEKLKEELRNEREKISAFNSPILTTKIFAIVCVKYVKQVLGYLSHHKVPTILVLLLCSGYIAFHEFAQEHQSYTVEINRLAWIGSWWVFLGILSSVGLGTGLHTFVLYLGPLIAKTAIAAAECKSVDFELYGSESFVCPEEHGSGVTFWQLLSKIQFEALMWGAGTAIGELPPYFVARAARLAGESLNNVEGFEDLPAEIPEGFIAKKIYRVKKFILSLLNNLGFMGILLFASIPNPLFDLAGIVCGHFLVPFMTFFGATLIGKAVIKAHIQTCFVIVMFSEEILGTVIKFVDQLLPFMQGNLIGVIEAEKAKLHRVGGVVTQKEKSLLSYAWDSVLIIMLLYFLHSIVNSSVQQYLRERDERTIAKAEGSQNKRND